MRRDQFEHLIAAAADVAEEKEIVVIGSQAIHGSPIAPPEEVLVSMEADVYPLRSPEKAEDIDGSIGDGSLFQQTHGVYAHGVEPGTVVGPAGWKERLVRLEIQPRVHSKVGAVALCLELHDLVLAKCARGSERDWEFARVLLAANLVGRGELLRRLADLPAKTEASTVTQVRDILEHL